MQLPTLYKVDNKGKVREWDVKVIPDINQGFPIIQVIHGSQNGSKQVKVTVIKSGKNIGKANETTALQQAESEAESKWNKQKDKGYSETIVAKTEREFRPMLAQSYKDHSDKIVFPCYVQPKLDGLRCNISLENGEVVARSRKGKVFRAINHITQGMEKLTSLNQFVLDGELYTDKIDFESIVSGIKRDEPNLYTPLIEFWCYDLHVKSNPKLTFADRTLLVQDMASLINIKPVETKVANSHDEIFDLFRYYTKLGFEGVMARNAHSLYEIDKRSYHLQKVKEFVDCEFEIIGMKLDKNDQCVFNVRVSDKVECEVLCEGSQEYRNSLYNQKNIGKMLTVEYFGFTSKGSLRFPKGKGLRDYE